MDKQYILSEIKRTTGANGGKPLGVASFCNATGIKRSDWEGKHWARWGDALIECGFRPNQLRGPADPTDTIEKFITFMRELGTFPTKNEIMIKARETPGFLWNPTAKFGSKQAFAERILAYCASREGYDDVVVICHGVARLKAPKLEDENPSTETFGFVYLIKSGAYHKLGRSNAAGRREYELAIQLPEKATTVHSIRTDDPVGIEAYWHKRFEDKRKNGEWFDLTSSDVKAFKRRKFM